MSLPEGVISLGIFNPSHSLKCRNALTVNRPYWNMFQLEDDLKEAFQNHLNDSIELKNLRMKHIQIRCAKNEFHGAKLLTDYPVSAAWHQDTLFSEVNFKLIIWSNIFPTHFRIKGDDNTQIYQSKRYEVLMLDNKKFEHRVPPDLTLENGKNRMFARAYYTD